MAKRNRHTPRAGDEDLMAWYVRDRMRPDPAIDADVTRSCSRKAQYASEDDARAHALMNGMRLSSYECRYCGFWHLTRRPG